MVRDAGLRALRRRGLDREAGAVAVEVGGEAGHVGGIGLDGVELAVREDPPAAGTRRGRARMPMPRYAARTAMPHAPPSDAASPTETGAPSAAARNRWATPAVRKIPPCANIRSSATPSSASTCMPRLSVPNTP